MPEMYLKTGAQQEVWWSEPFYSEHNLSIIFRILSHKRNLVVTAIKCVFIDFITCQLVFHFLHSDSRQVLCNSFTYFPFLRGAFGVPDVSSVSVRLSGHSEKFPNKVPHADRRGNLNFVYSNIKHLEHVQGQG